MQDLSIRPSPGKGRGVFAERDFAEGDLIERCPGLVFTAESRQAIGRTLLDGYYFNWVPRVSEVAMIALGYGSIYNHSSTPNADWISRIDENMIDFIAQRPISAGEEILIHYQYASDSLPAWYVGGEGTEADALTQSPDEAKPEGQ